MAEVKVLKNNRILVKRTTGDVVTSSGVLLPFSEYISNGMFPTGIVVMKAENVRGIEIGDTVSFQEEAGHVILIDKEPFVVMKANQVFDVATV